MTSISFSFGISAPNRITALHRPRISFDDCLYSRNRNVQEGGEGLTHKSGLRCDAFQGYKKRILFQCATAYHKALT